MKTLFASLLALGLVAGAASAKAPQGFFDDLARTAPKSVFDTLAETAPRSIFDDLRDVAPHDARVFQDLQKNAP